MAPARRATAAVQQSGGSVAFGEDGFYAGGGFDLPPGAYALEFNVQMYQPTKANGTPGGAAFLCVMLNAHPFGGGEVIQKPLSLGSKAHLSYTPSADGKGIDPIPGGPGGTLNDITNWNLFRKSLRDCGMPEGTFVGDLSPIDGVWVRTNNVEEPESRKNMPARTGEAAETAQPRKPGKVPVVIEILDGGAPWEGGGGFELPEVAAAAPAVAAKVGPKAVARVAPKAAAPAPAVEEAGDAASDDDVLAAAQTAISDHLGKPANANGCPRLALRTAVFQYLTKNQGDEMAQAVINTYFTSDATVNAVLGDLGYTCKAGQVKVAA